MAPEQAKSFKGYGTFTPMTLEESIAAIIASDPTQLDQTTPVEEMKPLSHRALCKIAMKNVLVSVNYRTHLLIGRVLMPFSKSAAEKAEEVKKTPGLCLDDVVWYKDELKEQPESVQYEIFWYKENTPKNTDRPEFAQYLETDCSQSDRNKYIEMTRRGVASDELLSSLIQHSRLMRDINKAVSGWKSCLALKEFLEAHNQTIPLVDPREAMKTAARLRILNILCKGRGNIDAAVLSMQI